MSNDTELDAILLQYRAELKHGLNEMAGHDPLEQAKKMLIQWRDTHTQAEPAESTDLRETIEDWLDNAAHSGRLPVKINFSDIQKIAECLAPNIQAHTQAEVERAKPIKICGRTIDEIIVILNALDIERATDIEVTMSNLGSLYKKLREEVTDANRKSLDRAFATLNKGEDDELLE